MTWKLPKRLPRTGSVVDSRDFNDALMHVVEEDGRLNEHNWNDDLGSTSAVAGQLTMNTHMETDAAFRYFHYGEAVDASELYNSVPAPDFFYASRGWQAIPELSITFTTPGGFFYIWSSMQFSIADMALGDNDLVYTRFAVRLNGAILPISVIGDQDSYSSGTTMETGLSGRSMGVDIDHSIKLSAGTHTLDIVIDPRAISPLGGDLRSCIYSKNFLVWEMW